MWALLVVGTRLADAVDTEQITAFVVRRAWGVDTLAALLNLSVGTLEVTNRALTSHVVADVRDAHPFIFETDRRNAESEQRIARFIVGAVGVAGAGGCAVHARFALTGVVRGIRATGGTNTADTRLS